MLNKEDISLLKRDQFSCIVFMLFISLLMMFTSKSNLFLLGSEITFFLLTIRKTINLNKKIEIEKARIISFC